MRTTIDKAGRIVIPKVLRDRVGLQAGEVEITERDSGLVIEAVVAPGRLVKGKYGRLVFPATGTPLTDEMVRKVVDEDRARGLDHLS
jgi:AbrB family looped-hinge helix DNA binding protein